MSKLPPKASETGELREDLQGTNKEQQRNAIRKVIASMTVGRDVSNLFSDVVRLITSQNPDIKKLVYLYVMANARLQQDKAVALAGSFVKDAMHGSSLIRGLAVRTMSALQVDKMTDHIVSALRSSLRDSDPYVRRCAATAIAKVFAVSRARMEDAGFLHHLHEMLCDSNPTVIASAVCALNEIKVSCDVDRDQVDLGNRSGGIELLSALGDANGCNEWGQIYILEGLATYEAETREKAELICSRVLSKLQHVNAAVVLTTVRIIMNYMEKWGKQNPADVKSYCAKIAPPLVSLVSGGSDVEIRYVALRNIRIVLQRYPELLTSQIKVFFVKYNDPIYIKMEKVEIMLQLVTHQNARGVLSEFNEYAQEVDVEFVRKAVRAIGYTAIKIESIAEECASVLSALIATRVNYVVQESIVVVRDVFRKYPGRYEGLISLLCESLDTLDEPEAKASMVWIIGEYAENIENADELLDDFLETFTDESTEVQLSILTAIVKLFLKRPNDTQELLQKTLQAASGSDVPDVRDRGYTYWRLLAANPQAASAVVTGPKATISDEGSKMDGKLVNDLVTQVGTLASVFHKPPDTFVQNYFGKNIEEESEDSGGEEEVERAPHDPNLPQFGYGASQEQHIDPLASAPSRTVWCGSDGSQVVELQGRYIKAENGSFCVDVKLTNASGQTASGFFMQFNVNSFGIALGDTLNCPDLSPGETYEKIIPLTFNPANGDGKKQNFIHVALKTNFGVGYGATGSPMEALYLPKRPMSKEQFLQVWKAIDKESQFAVSGASQQDIDAKLQQNGYAFVAKRSDPSQDGLNAVQDHYYYNVTTITGAVVAIEAAYNSLSPDSCMISLRTTSPEFAELTKIHILAITEGARGA